MNQATAQQDDKTIDGEITVVKPDNALVVMDPIKYAAELFEPFRAQLAQAKRRANREKYDITTKAGMSTAKELRAAFVKIRTTADKSKTEAKRPIDQAGKLILSEFQTLTAAVKAEEDKHDAVIVAEEKRLREEQEAKIAAERARVEAIENRIDFIRKIPAQLADADSVAVFAKIEDLSAKRLDPAMYEEYLEQAVTAINETVDALRELHTKAVAREAEARRVAEERAELARLKAEADECTATENREREQREAQERDRAAEAKRLADEQAKMIADLQAKLAAAEQKEAPKPVPINSAGQYYSTTTFKENGEPILCNADGSRSIFCDVADDYGPETGKPVQVEIVTDDSGTDGIATTASGAPIDVRAAIAPGPMRPHDMAIVSTLAGSYGVEQRVIVKWLRDMDLAALAKQFNLE